MKPFPSAAKAAKSRTTETGVNRKLSQMVAHLKSKMTARQALAGAPVIPDYTGLIAALKDVLEHYEWAESGGPEQAAYDAAKAELAKLNQ